MMDETTDGEIVNILYIYVNKITMNRTQPLGSVLFYFVHALAVSFLVYRIYISTLFMYIALLLNK